MKKIIYKLSIILFFIVFLSTPFVVNAISGTCSWHGGINCKAGMDWDGSAICNDGWRDSSEMFLSANICAEDHHWCTQEELNELGVDKMKEDLLKINSEITIKTAALEKQLAEIEATPMTLARQTGAEAAARRIAQADIMLLQAQAQAIMNNITFAYQRCLELGDAAYHKRIQESYQEIGDLLNKTETSSCPENSYYNYSKSTCSCIEDFYISGGKCIYGSQFCREKFGQESLYNSATNRCDYCTEGYKMNQDKTCTKIQGQVLGASTSNPLSLQSGWLIKNKKFVEVFSVDENLCLHWIRNEKVALKHFGITWNYEGNIKEFDSIPSGYKFCNTLE